MHTKITNNPSCALCHQEAESIVHLFLKCSTAKALWCSCCWGLKLDHPFFTSEDITKLLIDPPKASCPSKNQWFITLNMAAILDEIWRVRNHILHHGGIVVIHAFIKHIHQCRAEVSSVSTIKEAPSCNNVALPCRWHPLPPLG